MPEKHGNIDELFQEAASQVHYEFNEKAWAGMESMLDQTQPVVTESPKSWKAFYIIIGVILVMVITFMLLPKDFTGPNGQLQTTTQPGALSQSTQGEAGSGQPAQQVSPTASGASGASTQPGTSASTPATAASGGQSSSATSAGDDAAQPSVKPGATAGAGTSSPASSLQETSATASDNPGSSAMPGASASTAGSTQAQDIPPASEVPKTANAAEGGSHSPASAIAQSGSPQSGSKETAAAETGQLSTDDQSPTASSKEEDQPASPATTSPVAASGGTALPASTANGGPPSYSGQDESLAAGSTAQPNDEEAVAEPDADGINTTGLATPKDTERSDATPTLSEDREATTADLPAVTVTILPRKAYRQTKEPVALGNDIPDTEKQLAAYGQPEEIIPDLVEYSPWLITFEVSPALSGIGLDNLGNPDMLVGLAFEYQLTPRLSIFGGVNRSVKTYGSTVEEYTLPGSANFGKEDVSFVDASCEVIDVPLNLRYQLLPNSTSRLFISTGLSSYFMLREDYKYTLLQNQREWNWSVEGQNQHLFGVWNFSLGYQKALNDRFLVGIEPYLKVPLRRVAAPRVRLLTAGTFFNLTYRLRASQKRRQR